MNKTYNEPLNRWALQCLKDSMALHESQLKTTHIDGDTYAVPVPVAQEIERLRAGLAVPWKVSDDLCEGLLECPDKLRKCEAKVSRLHRELEVAWKIGDELNSELLKCQAALARLRGDSQYPAPTSTAAELPPEGEDILWWYPHRYGSAWAAGRYEASEDFPPGYLTGGGTWCLCDGPQCDGPTWWMYPPPSPAKEV